MSEPNVTTLRKNDDSHLYKIKFEEDETVHSFDIISVVLKMDEAIKQQQGKVSELQALQNFKNAIGLPDLDDSNAYIVLHDFQRYCTDVKKHMPQLAELLDFTDAPEGV